jgi:hypothetical protein
MDRKTFDELQRLCEILKYARHITKRAYAQRDLEKYGPIAIPELIEGINELLGYIKAEDELPMVYKTQKAAEKSHALRLSLSDWLQEMLR